MQRVVGLPGRKVESTSQHYREYLVEIRNRLVRQCISLSCPRHRMRKCAHNKDRQAEGVSQSTTPGLQVGITQAREPLRPGRIPNTKLGGGGGSWTRVT